MGFAASSPDKARNFTIKETPIENFRPLKVRVIGAGYSGIYLGIRIPQKLRNIDLKIYEKNEGVGGTWWENRYPGCACDIPAHSYQYSFEPNSRWSGFYAPSAEIRSYLEHVSQKYGVPRFLELSHKVVECTWLEKTKKWKLVVEKTATGETFEEEADFVISCRGNLNEISWPNIPGFKNFEGELMHSAAWNDSYDFENKRIGVIGGGSSSIQIVPQLQKVNGAKVACFMRNKSWISNPFGEVVMQKLGLDPNVLEFTEEQKQEFERNPKAYLKFRKTIEADGNAIHGLTSDRSSKDAAAFVEILKDVTAKTLSTKSEILSSFTPAFGIGCRRLTPGVGFLEALVQENVDFIPDPIARVNGSGLELENGKQVDIDVLVCATGFDTSHVPPFEVTGKNGSTLRQKFQPFPQTYLSVAVDDFPNFFMMLGPNAGIGAGSLTLILEGQGDYIIKCLRKLQKEDYVCMVPRSARVRDFSDYIGEYFKRTVYMDACESWYKSEGGKSKGKEERVTALWPGSSLHMLETLRAPRWEDYEFESSEENRLRWLGNGWSICLMEGQGDPSWYINPDVVDVPPAGTPESDPQNSIRVFSH